MALNINQSINLIFNSIPNGFCICLVLASEITSAFWCNLCSSTFSFLCSIVSIIICSFVNLPLAIELHVLVRFANYDCHFGIAHLFLLYLGLVLCCVTPVSTIFQLYSSCKFYWWTKPDKFDHIMLYRVHLA